MSELVSVADACTGTVVRSWDEKEERRKLLKAEIDRALGLA